MEDLKMQGEYSCQACDKFMWKEAYIAELGQACRELEILRPENAELRSIVGHQQVQIDALMNKLQSISCNQQDDDYEAYEDSEAVADAFHRKCKRLIEVSRSGTPVRGSISATVALWGGALGSHSHAGEVAGLEATYTRTPGSDVMRSERIPATAMLWGGTLAPDPATETARLPGVFDHVTSDPGVPKHLFVF
ncbi:hypothetical protein GUJ93_ZPchr0015g6943 [Zizania palustris]|uniref:Uncharacterized protein n=1 Tax=Zizania palustris TaxID=103762 RepID=A0A8J5W712_ZIZPA|nr:hypothetical protein GUJ93_ZPchr0015g6943 [Zizania palustris]